MKSLFRMKLPVVLVLICLALVIHSSAQTVTAIASFNGNNGFNPASGLVQGVDGNFYGVTPEPGIGSEGNVYNVSPAGALTSVFNFCSNGCSNGQFPFNQLVLATNGYFYGTTSQGGTALQGNIFKITPGGTETSLYSFCVTTCDDGSSPSSALIQSGGYLYGTTTSTIFKMTLGGTLTTLYNFCNSINCTDFGPPYPSSLVLGSDGNFYGVTSGGNVNAGTVFKMTPSGTLTTLHTFSGSDGSSPMGSLVQGLGGGLYGVTLTGGNTSSKCPTYGTCGVIFKITPSGTFTVMHKFNGNDGANPFGSLIVGADENYYGTSWQGGAHQAGTIFRMTAQGGMQTVYSFCSQSGCLDGSNPESTLLASTSGMLYGTTKNGGTDGDGTVFSLSLGFGPSVATIPGGAKVGTKVMILGYGLTGTTSVTFNGVAAAFTVVSDTEITATVPAGAATGVLTVTTPSIALNDRSLFRVTH